MRAWILLLAWTFWGVGAHAETRDADTHFFQPKLGEFAEELASTRRENKHGLLLMFESETCGFCQGMRANVLNRPDVQDYFRRHFLVHSVDVRGDLPIIDFQGRASTERAFARAQGVRGTPTLVFYGADGEELVRHIGAVRTAEEFLLLGRYVVEGVYKRNLPFSEFRRQAGR